MEKIYGYKEKDVVGLAQFLSGKENQPLSRTFEEYAMISKKAKGTVRNLYYALAKLSQTDRRFCDKYLGGKSLTVNKIVEFSDCEERQLIKKILLAKNDGLSVRSEIMRLSGGDGKIALRLQNKYRNAVKNKPELIEEVKKDLISSGVKFKERYTCSKEYPLNGGQFEKLKNEINNLVAKISVKIQRENEFLKERVALLERENLKLSNLLYGVSPIDTVNYFGGNGGKKALN